MNISKREARLSAEPRLSIHAFCFDFTTVSLDTIEKTHITIISLRIEWESLCQLVTVTVYFLEDQKWHWCTKQEVRNAVLPVKSHQERVNNILSGFVQVTHPGAWPHNSWRLMRVDTFMGVEPFPVKVFAVFPNLSAKACVLGKLYYSSQCCIFGIIYIGVLKILSSTEIRLASCVNLEVWDRDLSKRGVQGWPLVGSSQTLIKNSLGHNHYFYKILDVILCVSNGFSKKSSTVLHEHFPVYKLSLLYLKFQGPKISQDYL